MCKHWDEEGVREEEDGKYLGIGTKRKRRRKGCIVGLEERREKKKRDRKYVGTDTKRRDRGRGRLTVG